MALSTRVELPAQRLTGGLLASGLHHALPAVSLRVALPGQRGTSTATNAATAASLSVLADEEIIERLSMRIVNRGWLSGRSTVVFGDRALADCVRESGLAAGAGPAYLHPSFLHVFVKLSDVEDVSVRTLMREFSLANPGAVEPRLTAALAAAASAGGSRVRPALPAAEASEARMPVSAEDACLPPVLDAADAAGADSRAVVHLVISKSARVQWRHMQGDRFELSITSSPETVDALVGGIDGSAPLALAAAPSSTQGAASGAIFAPCEPLVRSRSDEVAVTSSSESGSPRSLAALSSAGRRESGAVLELLPHEPGAAPGALADAGTLTTSANARGSSPPSLTSPAHQLHSHWQAARAGLAGGFLPSLAAAGTGGSYFLRDTRGRPVAVFKPADEEPLAANNPKGRASGGSADGSNSSSCSEEGLRRGTRPGEGAAREVAAYLLDHDRFAGVPPTALVSVHVSGVGQGGPAKVGSLQQFVDAECDAEERGCSSWPVQEVHKIAVLDMRLANTDRNGSNILARRDPDGGWQLVPIDHGYALPASLEDLSFEWAWWPQADVPFDERTRSYIARLDADADLQLLGAHGISLREECATVFRIATLVLQKGAAAGLTAGQIAGLLSRQGAARSTVERLWAAAQRLARARGAAALGELSLLLDQYIAEEHALEGDMTL